MTGAELTPSGSAPGDLWRLDGRVALVTGASTGLGARFARVLQRAGAQVLATARRADLLAAPSASVIHIASVYGIVASRPPMTAYNATKGAVISLTRQLAAQWGERGVRVNALAPGYFPTELTGFLADADLRRSICERTLLGRTPALHELDGPLLFLATAASSYMTGQVLVIDGGWTAA
jgi:NAD(P)-dependent dehydrogenase (short-subunit alcohol dehydrogenase family)